jgi:hypothetical protein
MIIPPKNKITFRRFGFSLEAFRKKSDASDFLWKRSGRNPTLRILSGSVPEEIRRFGFSLEAFRKKSDASDFVWKRSGNFPTLRISCIQCF